MNRRDFLKGLAATCAAAPFLKLAMVAPPSYDDRQILRIVRHLSRCDELMIGIERRSALMLDNWGIQMAHVCSQLEQLTRANPLLDRDAAFVALIMQEAAERLKL